MKMFNWVHRKFHYTPLKAEFAETAEKNGEFSMKDVEMQQLLKQVDEIIDALTIITAGFEKSLKPRNIYQRKYVIIRRDSKRDEEAPDDVDDASRVHVDEELNPLMSTTIPNNFDDSGEHSAAFEKSQVIIAIDHAVQRIREIVGSDVEEEKRTKGPRTTLADLFMADSEANQKTELEKMLQVLSNKPDVQTKKAHFFPKKPKKELQRTRNFGGLMKKIMKRKIHADIDEKQQINSESRVMDSEKYRKKVFEESISLLPFQAASA